MLRKLHIENYVLIDSLDISFPEGLSIITGETGAGKSILLGALGLLLGAKADASHISEGAQNCVVEGEFDSPESLREAVEEAGAEWDPQGLTIRRVLNSTGRSRAFVNDCPVQASLLQDIAAKLVDIHSQDQTRLLRDRSFQQAVLDHFAGVQDDVDKCRALWKKMLSLDAEFARLSSRRDSLNDAKLIPGELETLETEQKQLENAESIKEALGGAAAVLDPQEGMSVAAALKEAARLLDKVSSFVPAAESLSERLRSSRIEIEDIAESISDADSHINLSQERLDTVNERISLIYSLFQKYRCSSVEELIEKRESFGRAVSDSGNIDEQLEALEKERKALSKAHLALCSRIHDARVNSAPALAKEILSSLRFLELERALFEVHADPVAPGADGSDNVWFAFSASGATPA